MYPGGGPDQNQHNNGWSGEPGQQPEYQVPQDPYLPDPSYPQPAPEAGYPQPGYPPPGYPQSGYAQPGYPQPGYPQTVPYSPAPAPPPATTAPNQGVLVLAVAGVAIFAIVAVVGVAIWVVSRSGNRTTAGPGLSTSPTTQAAQAPASPPGPADPVDGLVTGSGPVRVDVWVDYQCPPCSLFEEATGEVLTDYVAAQRVTLSIHPVAFIDDRSKNNYATRAAAAMACAHEQGKGPEFHSYLLRHQPAEDTAGPTDENLIVAGNALGLGQGFDSCVSGQQKIDWVSEATDAADEYGVSSVPAVYVNDHSVQTTRSSLVTAIDNAR